jgi:iron(III) transport system substrate-binding protein
MRVLVYNTRKLTDAELPDDIFGLCDSKWRGRIGWAPANGSFQAFVTALRRAKGEDTAREWLLCMRANRPGVYPKNTPIVAAVGAGEIDVGLVNHYYLLKMLDERGESFPARNYVFRAGGPGAMINVAGVGVLATSTRRDAAEGFIRFLLSADAQQYFATTDYEYPLAGNVPIDPRLVPLDQLSATDPDLDGLDDLQDTLKLLQDLGIL